MKITFAGGEYITFAVGADDITMTFFDKNNVQIFIKRYTAGAMRMVRDKMTKAIIMAEVADMSQEELDQAIAERKKAKLGVVVPFPRKPVGKDEGEE